MSLTIKAVLKRTDRPDAEIRRFQIPADVSSSYAYLSKKMVDIFPALKDGNFSLYWTDPDSDRILFSTDGELIEALGFVTDSVFKIYVTLNEDGPQTPNEDHEMVQPGVVCDGCEAPSANPPTPKGPMGPHGPGSFVPTPHFRRWMQKFMKRWHNRNASGWEGADKDGDTKEGDKAEEKMDEGTEGKASGESSGEECLDNVGETEALVLDPFCIDVDAEMDAHTDRTGKRDKKCPRGEGNGRGGRGCRKGHRGGCVGRHRRHRGQDQGPLDDQPEKDGSPQTDKAQQGQAQTDKQKSQQGAGKLDGYVEAPVDGKIRASQSQMDVDPSGQKIGDNTWTLIETSPSPTPAPSNPTTSTATRSGPLYPPADLKIAEALQQMMAMGFNNEGGWLTSLLKAKNGDIIQVLDAIKPQQRHRQGPEGNMA